MHLWQRAIPLAPGGCYPGLPWDTLPVSLMVLLEFPLHMHLGSFEAGSWAAENLQYTATLQPAVGGGVPSADCHTAVGSGQWILLSTAALCQALDNGTPAEHCPTARGQGAVELRL